MSIKIYNEHKNTWDKASSMLASSHLVTDANGNYNSENVEGCLEEIADNIRRIDKNVKYIFDNGTMGGGSGPGSGGASVPTIKLDGELDAQGILQIIAKSDEIIDIYYFFNSPNPGNGTVELAYGSNVKKEVIKQGRNKWSVGPFPRGTHNLSIVVEDRQGFMSDPARIKVISGALEITSDFTDAQDFNLLDYITVPYRIHTELPEVITAEMTLNGTVREDIVTKGDNIWVIGELPNLGVHTASLKVYSQSAVSNTLDYTLVVSDSERLFVSTKFTEKTFPQGKNLQIDYRISMKGQYQFKTNLYLNDVLVNTVRNPSGVSYWDLGNDLPLGVHRLKIESMTLDEVHKDILELEIEIVESGLIQIDEPVNGLIAKFDANGKSNIATNKKLWEDKSGNGVVCNLYNFNYATNGWLIDEDIDQTVLKFSGRTYAEIDLKPFVSGVNRGFTFDIYFKVTNTGNMDAKVVSCRKPDTPFVGFMIDTEKAILSSKQSVKGQFQENQWTRLTFVIDRLGRTIRTYTNAVISNASLISPKDPTVEDEWIYDGKIILGAARDVDGNIVDNSTCSIRNIRIYNRALTHEEILNIHMYDIKNAEELTSIYELNYGELSIPTLQITGTGIDSMVPGQDPVTVKIDYMDPAHPDRRLTRDICQLQIQGTSSKDYPVKNYTLWLRENDGQPKRDYAPVAEWMPEDRWTLKTNYMDSSHANNVGLNKFIHDLFKENPYPQQQINASTRSNVDGIPIKMIVNGKDAGIYTWNIDRYAHNTYGLVTYNEDGTINRHNTAVQYEIAVNSTNGAGAFNDDSWDSIRREFKHRYNYRGDNVDTKDGSDTVLVEGQHSELVDLVSWVKNCTDDDFFADVEKHFSLAHLIDYYLVAYAFGMIDNLGKNMVLTTFGLNEHGHRIWYPSFYDCDSVLGLANNGEIRYDAGVDMDAEAFNTKNSSLWVKLKKMFPQKIKDRYTALRRERNIDGLILPPIFSAENVMKYLDDEVMNKIGQIYYNQDAERKYINDPSGQPWMMMCNGKRKEFTMRWLEERFRYLDSVYEANDYLLKSMVLRTHVLGNIRLRLKTYSPQWVRINYTSSSSKKIYVSKDKFYDFEVELNNDTENDFTLYGADNLMYVDGIEGLNVSHINIAGAEKLIEVNVSESPHIKGLALGSNSYLQKVICNDCPRLGEDERDKTIDLSKCTNLRYVDCSSKNKDKPTKINTVILPSSGGVIETLKLENTDLTSFTMEGQEYLEELQLASCRNLDSLVVKNCNGLKKVTMPNTRLSTCIIEGCDEVVDIDISNTKYLQTLNLQGCPNLRKLNLSGVLSTTLRDLDLTYSLNLEELNISSTPYLEVITFGQYRNENQQLVNFNKLKKFNCANSAIRAIRYGKLNPVPDYMDLRGLNLDYITFDSCANISHIKNINLVATGSMAPFRYCRNLTTIEGTVSLAQSIGQAFMGCKLLTNLRNTVNLNLSRVTSSSEAFSGCESLTWDDVTYILSKMSGSYTGGWRTFATCKGLDGPIPENLLRTCTGITTMSEFFINCEGITGQLPSKLLEKQTSLSDLNHCFHGTRIEGAVPTDFLRYSGQNLRNVSYTFSNTRLDTAPTDNLFKYNRNLQNAEGTFSGCTNLTGPIPATIFSNKGELVNVSYFFNGCSNVYGEIPREFLKTAPTNGINKLRNVRYCLRGTDTYGEIPKTIGGNLGIFGECGLLEDVRYFFPKGVSGEIPADLFANNPKLTRVSGLFEDCTGIVGEIPSSLFSNAPNLMFADRLFKNCTGIDSEIPKGLFDICTQLTDVAEMFYGCTGLKGQIPERISEWVQQPSPEDPEIMEDVEIVHEYGLFDNCKVLATVSGLFYNCRNLRSTIPETLFIAGNNITDMSNIFANCYELYGAIPEGLFKNCSKVISMNSAFRDCCKLGKTALEITDDPYALPEGLFSGCRELATIDNLFCMWGNNPYGTNLRGELPRNLFRNNRKLRSMNAAFASCSLITGPLDSSFFINNIELKYCQDAFRGPKFTSIGPDILKTCSKLEDIQRMFMGNNRVTGPAPKLWLTPAIHTAGCFNGCTFDDQDTIPPTYK